VVRPSDESGADGEFTFQDAATARACAGDNLSVAVMAKRVVSRLWETTTGPPYTDLFPRDIEAESVWRAMVLQEAILKKISELREGATERHRTIMSHGNRFIEYKVFHTPELRGFANPQKNIGDLVETAVLATDKISRRLCDILCGKWRDEAVQYIFKYARKCEELDRILEQSAEPPERPAEQMVLALPPP
jgi:hypothetical protein